MYSKSGERNSCLPGVPRTSCQASLPSPRASGRGKLGIVPPGHRPAGGASGRARDLSGLRWESRGGAVSRGPWGSGGQEVGHEGD